MRTTTGNETSPLQLLAEVVAIQRVAPHHFRLSLHAPRLAESAQAGQFIHVLPRQGQEYAPLLRRAFSIMATQGEHLDILFRVGGQGTTKLAQRRVGDLVDILGPLGQPFDTSLFHVKQVETQRRAILVGGGIGVPPMVFLGKSLKEIGVEPLVIIGARSAPEVVGVEDFQQLNLEVRIATDDGTCGHRGRVTDLLEIALGESGENTNKNHDKAVIYACGPLPMLRAASALAADYDVPCQVSMEENMPCGIGVCNGCVVAMKGNSLEGYERYRRICVSGPAVWSHEIDWEGL